MNSYSNPVKSYMYHRQHLYAKQTSAALVSLIYTISSITLSAHEHPTEPRKQNA